MLRGHLHLLPALATSLIASCAASHEGRGDEHALSVNVAAPDALLARLCSYVPEQAMCQSPQQASAFAELLRTMRAVETKPLFATAEDFLEFAAGRSELYEYVLGYLGRDSPLLAWNPLQISNALREQLAGELTAENLSP